MTPWTAAYQAPPSMGFSRQEYWSGLPLPSLILTLGIYKYSQPSVFVVSESVDSRNWGSKILKKKKKKKKKLPEISKRKNLNLLCISNYFHNIYIVFITTYITFTLY